MTGDDAFLRWFTALWARHTRVLTFQEIRRALQALSSLYVERREKLGRGSALDGEGKRAAFAAFYGPLHFLTVRAIVRALAAPLPRRARILELGCGTASAGAAWALESEQATFAGVDRNGWVLQEARFTLSSLGVSGRAHNGDAGTERLEGADAVLLAWTVNELPDAARDALLPRLLKAAAGGAQVLVVEPLARKALTWWPAWQAAFESAGGRADEWRFTIPLPLDLARLDKAAGLDHRQLTARSLFLAGALRPGAASPGDASGGPGA